jgi:hypothetical protein
MEIPFPTHSSSKKETACGTLILASKRLQTMRFATSRLRHFALSRQTPVVEEDTKKMHKDSLQQLLHPKFI